MKIGKLPEQVLVRSVLRQIKHRREEVLSGPAVGRDCAALKLKDGEILVMSTDPITGTVKDMGSQAVHITANDLAVSGAEPLGIMLTLLLPDTVEEPQIRAMMQEVEATCEELGMEVLGGHTEITNVVRQPLISVTGVGKLCREQMPDLSRVRPGQDLVVTKWIGLEATAILAKEKEEELLKEFSPEFVRTAREFDRYLSVVPDAKTAAAAGVCAMHDITEGGVFGALWEVAEGANVGLEADLKKIPIRQETVEICEIFNLNPYHIMSSGSVLAVTEDGTGLVRELERAGIPAAVVGRTTSGKDRIVRNGEDVQYLTRPQTDELYKVMG